ncbi:MAG: DUF885 domain-containing protein [Verrucomicrobiales bacterium]|nr:DUF885 domain-containing protein [Verrucomicrobiales bacterium]
MRNSNGTQRAFEGILDRYFESTLADQPRLANEWGLRAGEGKMGGVGKSFERQQDKRRRDTLATLDDLAVNELSAEQHLDRLALRTQLLGECEDFARGKHLMEPDGVDELFGILLHELQRGEDEPLRARRNIRGLLNEAPGFLARAAGMIDQPERVWRRIMAQTVGGASAMFEALVVFMEAGDARAIASVKRAVEKYHDAVMAKPLAPRNSFALGAEYLQRRVRDDLGLDYTLGQVERLALGEAERVGGLLKAACAGHGKGRSAEEIIEAARAEWNPEGELLDVYRTETRAVAKGFRTAKAMTFPKGDELQVRLVPAFMRHLYPTAAYSSPGPFEKRQRGIFWVNDLSLTKNSPADKLAEVQQHFGISLTAAHEAYPGHHLQFVTANQHARKWRPLFAHAVFYEGWTLWCEQMMTDLRIDRSPWTQVIQLHDALWRVHRILVDLRLQTGRYSYEQGVRHMQEHLGFTKARAEADVNWYTSSPAVPMSYWLGRLENARLYRRLVEGRGWSLRRFNDWLLSFGTLPQSWLEKYGLD